MNANDQGPTTDLQDTPASVEDSAPTAPAMLQQQLDQLLLCHGIEAVDGVERPFDLHRAAPSQPDHIVLNGPALLLSRD